MKTHTYFLLCICLFFSFSLTAQNINKEDTRLLSNPAISNDQIAFIYAEDLWIANKDGSFPKRITVDYGIESNPVFSRSEEHTSELQSRENLVCRLLLEKK